MPSTHAESQKSSRLASTHSGSAAQYSTAAGAGRKKSSSRIGTEAVPDVSFFAARFHSGNSCVKSTTSGWDAYAWRGKEEVQQPHRFLPKVLVGVLAFSNRCALRLYKTLCGNGERTILHRHVRVAGNQASTTAQMVSVGEKQHLEGVKAIKPPTTLPC